MLDFYLATSVKFDIWDKNCTIVTFAENCAGIEQELASKYNFLNINSPWVENEKYHYAKISVDRIYQKFLPLVISRLESYHKVNYSEHSWRIIIGPWLYQAISVLYDRFYSIENAFHIHPNMWTHILDYEYTDIPIDSHDLHYLLTDDYYNFWLYSRVLLFKGYEFPLVKVNRDFEIIKPKSGIFKKITKQLLRKFNLILLKLFSSKVNMIGYSTYIPIKFEYLFSVLTKFKYLTIIPFERNYIASDVKIDDRKAILAPFKSYDSDFEYFLSKTLPFLLPKSLFENFIWISNKVAHLKFSAKYLVSAESWHYDEFFKRLAANHFDMKGILIGIQHGGTYGGVQSYIPHEQHELSIVNQFYSWGWEKNHMNKIFPFYAIKLTGRKQVNYNKNSKILFVGTGNSRYLINFQFLPFKLKKYFSDQRLFLNELDSVNFSRIVFRLFQQEYGWNYLKKIKRDYPFIQFDDNRLVFLDSLVNYRICVIDHISTTWLEALALNMPTIIFGIHNLAECDEEVQSYYTVLKKAKIIHDSPKDAAQFLKEIYDDVDSWWNSFETQYARKLVCEKYAKMSEKPLLDYRVQFYNKYLKK